MLQREAWWHRGAELPERAQCISLASLPTGRIGLGRKAQVQFDRTDNDTADHGGDIRAGGKRHPCPAADAGPTQCHQVELPQ
jgi:hypothetical protein